MTSLLAGGNQVDQALTISGFRILKKRMTGSGANKKHAVISGWFDQSPSCGKRKSYRGQIGFSSPHSK